MITNLHSVARNQKGKTVPRKWRLMKVTRLSALGTGRLYPPPHQEKLVVDISVRV